MAPIFLAVGFVAPSISFYAIASSFFHQSAERPAAEYYFHFALTVFIFLFLLGTSTLNIFAAISQMIRKDRKEFKWFIIVFIYASSLQTIFFFALVYQAIVMHYPRSFNQDQLSAISAFYFSLVTFATVGYGDIAPLTDAARLVTSFEVFVSMAYIGFLFASVPALLT